MLKQLPKLAAPLPAIPRLNTVAPSSRPPAPVDTTPLVVSGVPVNVVDLISFTDPHPSASITVSPSPGPQNVLDLQVLTPEIKTSAPFQTITTPLLDNLHKAPGPTHPTGQREQLHDRSNDRGEHNPTPSPMSSSTNNPLLAVSQPVLLSSPVSTTVNPQPTMLPVKDSIPLHSAASAPAIPNQVTPPTPTAVVPDIAVPVYVAPAPTSAVFSPVKSPPAFTWNGIDQQTLQSPPLPRPAEVWNGSVNNGLSNPPITTSGWMGSHSNNEQVLASVPQPEPLHTTQLQPVQYSASSVPMQEPAVAPMMIGGTISSVHDVQTKQQTYRTVATPVTPPEQVNPVYELYRPAIMSTTPPSPSQSTSTTVLTASNIYRLPSIGISGMGSTSGGVPTFSAPNEPVTVQTPMYQTRNKFNLASGSNVGSVQQDQSHTPTTPVYVVQQPQQQSPQFQPQPQLNLVPAMNHPVANLPEQEIPNYDAMPAEKQAQYRADFITKFGILRNSWKEMSIPELTISTGLGEMHSMYNTYVRQIHIQQNVDSYKQYIVAVWWILEVLGNKAGLNITGYAQSQMNSMSKYEKLLIELGENKYKETSAVSGGVVQQSQWPVELRLLGVALLNALIFIIVRTCVSYLGMDANVVQQVLGFFSGQNSNPQIAQIAHKAVQGNNTDVAIPDPPMPNQGGLGGILGNLLPGFLGNMLGGSQGGASGSANGLAGIIGQVAGAVMGQGNVQQPQQAAQPIMAYAPAPVTTPSPLTTPAPTGATNGRRARRTPQFAE